MESEHFDRELLCAQNSQAIPLTAVLIHRVEHVYDQLSRSFKYIHTIDTGNGEKGVMIADSEITNFRATDKNEQVSISDAPGKAMRVVIEKLNKGGQPNGKLLDMVYQPDITKEIRLYLQGGGMIRSLLMLAHRPFNYGW